MWRSLKLAAQKNRGPFMNKLLWKCYSSQPPSGSGAKRMVITLVTVCGVGTGVAVAYGKYDPKFRKLVEENVPYSDIVFKSIPDFGSSKEKPIKESITSQVSPKQSDSSTEGSLLKKKQERLKKESTPLPVEPAKSSEIKSDEAIKSDLLPPPPIPPLKLTSLSIEDKTAKTSINELETLDDHAVIESSIKELIVRLDRTSKEALLSQEKVVEAIKEHTHKLYQALDAPEDSSDANWKETEAARLKEATAVKIALQKISDSNAILEKLKAEVKKGRDNKVAAKSPLIFAGEEKVAKVTEDLKYAEKKVSDAQIESKTASEYNELVQNAREQFKSELKIVLPKYVNKSKDQPMTEDDLNLLIAHAHRRIENLQKEMARRQITEKQRIDEALHLQKFQGEKSIESQIAAEIRHHERQLRLEFKQQLESARKDFESDMRQQLCRQAAAHADHLQEALQVQNHELERKFNLELEERTLHQRGLFISEISESLSRLKGIELYLQANMESQKSARKVQALWLACQSMKDVLKKKGSLEPNSLAKELALLKSAAGEENAFVSTVLAGIPSEAIQRGVYTDECLKQRFERVKKVCKRVAMINDDNRSLYRYLLSYLQSFLIVDTAHIPLAELEGKVAVDSSEWDTFDILSRISFCLQRNDLEQALRYANQLRGQPKSVAKDWISEVRLLLETTQAVNCLITYAAAIGVQMYH